MVWVFAPRGTPKDIIGKLNAAAVEALTDPAVRSRFAALGQEIFPRERQTPEALGAMGSKSFNTSYGSEYKAALNTCVPTQPRSII